MQSAFFPQQQQTQHHPAGALPSPASASYTGRKASVAHTGSPARHATPGSISQTAAGSRALRFPSSRRYLWDKTAAGPQVLIDALDYLPHVQVAASTFGALSRASSNKDSSVLLQLDLSVNSSNQVTALIQEHDPLSAQGALQLSCSMSQPGAAAEDAAINLRGTLQAHIEQRDIARVQQLYALSASATAASPADLTSLRLQLLLPRAGLLATPLYTKRLCRVPLAEALLKPGCMVAGQTGYLSMDQARSLLPMEATDANVYSTPLVGVWVKGPSSVLHPLVTAACLRFAFSSLLNDRAVSPDNAAFLLLLCPEGDPVSKCFEVQVTDSSKLELCCYRLEAGVRPAAGLSQYPGGLVSATWVPDQRQVQPLRGTFITAGASSTLQAGAGGYFSHSKMSSAAGTPAQAAAGYMHRNLREPSPSAADSPVLYGHSHASRAEELQLGRSSAPTVAFGATGQLQQGAAAATAAARRSLPLTYFRDSYSRDAAAAGAAERPWEPHAAAGLAPLGHEDPQPRSGVPAGPYVPSTQGQGSSRPPWQQQQQQEVAEAWALAARTAGAADMVCAAAEASAGAGGDAGPCSTSSSPTRGSRQQQLTWSDRQDQVLRKSLEGAAEALRSSQACLAAAREAATGAGSRLSSPTKVCGSAGEGALSAPAAGLPDPAPDTAGGLGQNPGGRAVAAGGPCGSPQPGLSRLGQQQHTDADAESDCGPRMGSPVRTHQLQKKASMLAAAAAHAAGIGAVGASPDEAAADRPVSPAVQAGLALSNLSLLQHLSAGQLQQEGSGLEAVGNAAVAAAAGSPVAAGRSYAHQPQQQELSPEVPAGAGAHTFAPAAATSTGSAVAESYNASQGAAAAIRAATSSMQLMPVHPYNAQSLGVQRYAADVAVMRSSHGSPGGVGLMSPGSSPGIIDSSAANWQPLQQAQLPSEQQQDPGTAQLPSAWSPGMMSAATPGAVGASGSSRTGRIYWQQQQQYGVQQVSPVSAGLSPGWVPDPVAQALQGEVDRLRQQLQQLQQQLRLAGMALPNPDLDAASGAATPAARGASAAVTPQSQPAAPAAVTPAAAPAAGGSPMVVRDGGVHIKVYLRSGGRSPQVHMHEQQDAARAAAEQARQQPALPAPSVLLQQQLQRPAQRHPTVSYAGAAADAPQGLAVAAAVPAAGGLLAEAASAQQQSGHELAPAEVSAGAAGTAAAAEVAAVSDAHTQLAADAAASAARQRRRKLDFEATAAAAAQAAAVSEAAAQHPADSDGCGSTGSGGIQQGPAAQTVTVDDASDAAAGEVPAAAAELPGCAVAEDGSSAAVSQPVACSSPAIRHTAGAADAKAAPRHLADAVPAVPVATTAAGGTAAGADGLRSASSTAGMCYSVARSSVPRSSGGGLGHLRSSLDAPPLAEVVRTRVVDLSDDSDSDEWEDRLLVKYGLK